MKIRLNAEPMWFWYAIVFMFVGVYVAAFGLIMHLMGAPDLEIFWIVSIAFFVIGVVLLIIKGLSFATLDETGVRVRSLFYSYALRWDEITFVGVCSTGGNRLRTGMVFSKKKAGKKPDGYYSDAFKYSSVAITVEISGKKSKLIRELDFIKDQAKNAIQDNLNYVYSIGNESK